MPLVVPDLERELELVIDAFTAKGVAYALCGGLALAVHGFPRATKDQADLATLEGREE